MAEGAAEGGEMEKGAEAMAHRAAAKGIVKREMRKKTALPETLARLGIPARNKAKLEKREAAEAVKAPDAAAVAEEAVGEAGATALLLT